MEGVAGQPINSFRTRYSEGTRRVDGDPGERELRRRKTASGSRESLQCDEEVIVGHLRKADSVDDVTKPAVLCNGDELELSALAHNAAEKAEVVVRKIINYGWKVCHFDTLPAWLQDNDFLTYGHRPPLPSVWECIKSIFRIHTETGNIWTHLLGSVAFICVAVYFLSSTNLGFNLQEKLVFGVFFAGAIICLSFSFLFHMFCCHSPFACKLFAKLDYCGISFLIVGSFVPWVYFSFYCHYSPRIVYTSIVGALGIVTIAISLKDKFSEAEWRPYRTGLFVAFGLSAVIPAMHYGYVEGLLTMVSRKSIGWLALSGGIYIFGAIIYATRLPERWFPGMFNIWFQSHQIFHMFVLGGILVHYYGILDIAWLRISGEGCNPELPL